MLKFYIQVSVEVLNVIGKALSVKLSYMQKVLFPGGRVATVREKYLENEIFSRSGKSQGIL